MSEVLPRSHTAPEPRPRIRDVVRAYVALTKPRVVELLLVTTVPAMILAEEGLPDLGLILAVLLGGALAAGGANTINCWVERDRDQLMRRTRNRPLATGTIAPGRALGFGILLNVVAFAVLWASANLLAAALTLSATLFYVFVYTIWLKPRSPQNIVIGGAAGAVPVLVGWAAVDGSVSWSAIVLFLVIFLWTPPHFWALAIRHADEYRAASVPMLPVVETSERTVRTMGWYSVAVALASLALVPLNDMGVIYMSAAALLGVAFVALTFGLGRAPTPAAAMRVFSFSISYITLLFAAAMVDVLVSTR